MAVTLDSTIAKDRLLAETVQSRVVLNQARAFESGVGTILVDRLEGTGGETHLDMAPEFRDENTLPAQIRTEATGGIGGDVSSDTA